MAVQITAQGDWLSPGGTGVEMVASTGIPGTYVFQFYRLNQAAADDISAYLKGATRAVGDGATPGVARLVQTQDAAVDTNPTNLSVVETEPFAAPFGVEAWLEQLGGAQAVYPWILKRVG